MLRHHVLRPDGSIARELPACRRCHARLAAGEPLARVDLAHIVSPCPRPGDANPCVAVPDAFGEEV
jgi:hypothetical protein